MSESFLGEQKPVSFGERFTNSPAFQTLFRAGMDLVEETAAYLDGDGRMDSKRLDRSASLIYATESMRLTTRLMQLASWLLLHRAVREGEMSLAQAHKEKLKVKLSSVDPGHPESLKMLPPLLRDLIDRSMLLQAKIRRLDVTIHAPVETPAPRANQVEHQRGLLRAAFEQDHI
jgi:regulator of CtrA degradation